MVELPTLPASTDEKAFVLLWLLLMLLFEVTGSVVAVEFTGSPLLFCSLGSLSEAEDDEDGRRANLLDERMSTLPNIETPPIGF